MTSFILAKSEAEGWSAIAKELETGLASAIDKKGEKRLGWLYITDNLVEDLPSLVTYLRQNTGVDDWVGSVGMGICWWNGDSGGEAFGRAAAATLVACLPSDSFELLPPLAKSMAEIAAGPRAWIDKVLPPFGIVHGDPMNSRMAGLIESLSLEMENAALAVPGFLVGGLTSSRSAHRQISRDIVDGGLSGVLFASDVEVATGLTQGCAQLGSLHRVTDCIENVIITLNGDPALSVFKNDIGDLWAQDLSRVAGNVHAAFPIEGSDTGDYLVRNLVGIDPERGWLAVGSDVDKGDSLLFVRRDPTAAEEDLKRMVRELVERVPRPARGGLYFSCVARGASLFEYEGREIEIVGEALGGVPIVGFFGQGEISNNRLYGYTGVLVLFL